MTREGTSRRRFLRGTGGAVVGGALLYGTSQSALAQSGEAWSQFRYDDTNTGHAPENTGPVANIEQEWLFETEENYEGEDGSEWSSPAVVDGTVYIGRKVDDTVYAIDAESGTEEWRFVTDAGVTSSPAVVDGTVYIGSSDDNVYALDAEDGTEQWRYTAGSDIDSSPTVVGGTVYVGSGDDNVYALNADDGAEQWQFETGDIVWSTPAVANGTVYVGSLDNNVYALNSDDGTEQWSFETGGEIWAVPAVVDGTVYVGSRDNNVYALDADDGEELWSYETGDTIKSAPAVADGTVYIGSWDNNLYALDADDGTEEWSYDTGGSSSPAVVNNTVYVGDFGVVVAVSADDGTLRWSFDIEGEFVSSSPAVANGTVYFGANDSNVYAVTGNTSTPTPTPTPTPSPTSDGGAVLPIILGALGVGGVGAWWYRRQGGSGTGTSGGRPSGSGSAGGTAGSTSTKTPSADGSADTPPSSDSGSSSGPTSTATSATTSTSSEPDTEPSPDSGLLERVNDSLEEGDALRDVASHYRDAGEYDRALETYDEAKRIYEDALETGSESDLIDTDEIKQKLGAVEETRQEVHHQRLQEEVESLRSDLEHANTLADEGDREEAQERLVDLEARLLSAKETATQHNFDDLHDEITVLEQRREERLIELTERVNAHPVPGQIPRAPDVSVDYDALTDEEPIGGGGNADVSKATLPTPDGDVTLAIKRPRMAGTLHSDQVERMLAEAETWDKLDNHDHIVGVVDYGSAPIPWIAMEYMEGGHLGEQSGEMEIPQALWTALAVTKGVRHAHRRGIAHLDLKPQNVLFRTVEDAWDVPKVADWGLSKHLLEHSKSVEGLSPQYAAPEQFTDEYGPVDDITDIYQLGAVVYELFTGQPPFEGDPAKAMHQVLNEQPTPPSEIADVPDGLDEILLTALAKEKDDRYDDIVYLRDDLRELFDNW
jgi:outer membrane protein assembly factor BamB/serine/threonine protein kinase